jgi:hypothetical protein
MKENLLALGMFIGFFMLFYSVYFIVPISLLNDYLIYVSVIAIGLLVSIVYIFYNKKSITLEIEYLYIPIRSTLSIGCISVFSVLLINYLYRDQKTVTVKLPVESCFLDKESRGSKYTSRLIVRSAFVINYKGQTKNIVWHSRLEDTIMKYVKAVEIKKRKGFFGIDIIEQTNLVYSEYNLK